MPGARRRRCWRGPCVGYGLADYDEAWRRSTEDLAGFWAGVWADAAIAAERGYDALLQGERRHHLVSRRAAG